MHMADSLLSPAVGAAFWLASGSLIAYSAKKIAEEKDDSKTPLMGVMGAFVFAAQMINFTIPGTGSSGHIGGGMLLSILLGPYRAFIAIASVLTIQCLFFADGGLLALGCNIFNLGFFPAFIAYPLLYKKIMGSQLVTANWKNAQPNKLQLAISSISASILGLFLGACFVIMQTQLSGLTDLPFKTFAMFLLPIHLAIGLVEGLVIFGVLSFIAKVDPSLLGNSTISAKGVFWKKPVYISMLIITLLVGGGLALFASSNPDGLEWSMFKVTGSQEVASSGSALHTFSEYVQEKFSFLPDYSFRVVGQQTGTASEESSALGTTVSGIIGSMFVLVLAATLGIIFRRRLRKQRAIV